MIQIELTRFGPPEVLVPREAPDLHPGPGQVRVAVEAAGVNFAEVMARVGLYRDTPPLPAVLGWEVAGAIDAVGAGVPASRLGEPVCALCNMGGYASQVVVDAVQALRRPEGMTAVVGAAVPVHGLSAWMMVEEMGRVRPGDRVLLHSAGGGLGLMCLQLLKHRGAWVAGTASAHKHALLAEHGLDLAIDHRQDYARVLAGAEGLDLVLDPVGGASWREGFALLRAGGKLVCYGYSDAVQGEGRSPRGLLHTLRTTPWLLFNPIRLMPANKGIFGMELNHLWHERERVAGWLARVLELSAQGVMVPRVHAQVPYSQAPAAHRILHDRENLGKVVLVPDA